jgi:large subunit ribosomal protein L7/L12
MLWLRFAVVTSVVATGLIACTVDDPQPSSVSEHSVMITASDPEMKIRGIKAIRAETGLGLADAKRLIEETPSVVKTGLTRSEADGLAARLRAQGVTVQIQDE